MGIPARPIKIGGVPIPQEGTGVVSAEAYMKLEARMKELEEQILKLQKAPETGEKEEETP